MRRYGQIICSIIILLIFSLHSYSQLSPLKISVLPADGKEPEALISFLNTQGYTVAPIYIIHNEIAASPDIIWLHIDSSDLPDYDRNDLELLLQFVYSGGSLILSLDAARLINTLGLESIPLTTVEKEVKDEGYGRMLGLHAFKSHPVFEGLNGGAYLFKPTVDTTVRCSGFFGDAIPANGKVIAVDWDYIFLREEKKLVMEYEVGEGKILVIGGYLNYSRKNSNRLQLELFTKNVIDYLAGEPDKQPFYWSYAPSKVEEFSMNTEKVTLPGTKTWPVIDNYYPLKSLDAKGDYIEVAGERILVMGKERAGVEEVWIHPFMALRDFEAGIFIKKADSICWLKNMISDITIRPSSIERNYNTSEGKIREVIVASPIDPVAVIHYEYSGKLPLNLITTFSSNLRIMWPYSEKVTGDIFYTFNKELNAWILRDRTGDYVTIIGSDVKTGNKQVISSVNDPLLINLSSEYLLKKQNSLDIVIAGSSTGIEDAISEYRQAIQDPYSIYISASEYVQKNISSTVEIISPDPVFNEGYTWAKVATDRFRVNTPGIGTSLVAGYSTTRRGWDGEHNINGRPGYGWYFGRDGEWSAFALLDYGDFETVKQILETFNRFQDLNGKIFHELSTSGFAHYDASDATPLYVVLAGRYLRQSGDSAFIRNSWPNIQKAINYCYSTDTDNDLLIENTNVGHGWVEGGPLYGSHTSLYLASCWAEALEEAAFITDILGEKELSNKYKEESDSVIRIINTKYWNQDMGYFHHGLFKDGTFLSEPSVLPTIPILFGQADKQKSEEVMNWVAHNNFTTDWGCRILADNSPVYNPGAYHSGSVWPLFTGWVSLAEFSHNRPVQGFMHAYSNLLNYQFWGKGYVEEVLHGKQFKPFGVCPHQCWSETMVLMPLIEGMLGMKANALENSIDLSPAFPADWKKVEVKSIRVGDHILNFMYENSGNKITYKFTHTGDVPLTINLLCAPYYLSSNPVKEKLTIESSFEYEFNYEKGIYLLPYIAPLKPDQENHGFRMISQDLTENQFTIVLEGRANSTDQFRIWAPGYEFTSLDNARIINKEGDVYTLETTFRDTDIEFNEQLVVIHLSSNFKNR